MTTPRHEVFLPDLHGGTEIQLWYKVILNHYMLNRHISMSVEEDTLPVTQIKRYKVQGGAEHEYLVAKVEPRNVGISPVYIKLERAGEEDPKPRTQVDEPTPPKSTISTSTTATSSSATAASILSSSASIVTVSSSSSSQHPAKDQVMFLNGWPIANGHGTDVIGDSHFQKTSIFDLLAACVATHENEELYDVFTFQCYWFANLTTQILLRNDHTSTSKSLGQADDAILVAEEADHFTPGRGGTFFGISIHQAKEGAVSALLDMYRLKKKMNLWAR